VDRLKYISSESFYEAVIVDFNDCSVTMEIKGRLGRLKVPRRMVITEYDIKVGMTVGFMLSYPEVLGPEVDEEEVYKAHRQLEAEHRTEQYYKNLECEDK
jgi:hypothetical protein